MRQTIVGVFDKYAAAQQAAQILQSTGVPADHVHVTSQDLDRSAYEASPRGDGVLGHVKDFFSDLFRDDDDRDVAQYAEAVRRGGAVVKVDIDEDSEVPLVEDALHRAGAVDIEEQVDSWRASGWSEAETPTLRADLDEDVIPVVREELEVGKRVVSRGGVRVYAHTVERPVQESVELRSETAEVQRRPVDRPASAADLADLGDRTIEVRETEERAVVQKTARVVEEVSVGKRVDQRTEHVADTLRNTELEVERLSDDDMGDDTAFRSHFDTTYATGGSRYEEFAPAYQYGYTLRNDARYQGQAWDDIETDARGEWETRHPGSTWERFKAAIRHGWEGMTR